MNNIDPPREIYTNNPLDEVSCTLRFSPILKIDAELPAGFQDRIRGEFPLYETKSSVKLPAGLPKEFANAVERDLSIPGTKYHSFGSADRVWNVRLSRDSVGLACRKYDRWENFRKRLELPFNAIRDIYSPPFFTHVCLKYRDVIRRKRLRLESVPWGTLLQPWVTGPLGHITPENSVESTQTVAVIQLPEGLGKNQTTMALGIEEPSKERVFVIDAHLFCEPNTEPSHVFDRLDALNRQAGLFFRRCITNPLRDALGPNPV